MSDYNHLTITGRLTRDIELAYLPSGTPVATTSLASNQKYKDKENTCFIEVKMFGKQCEAFAKYLKKGDPVLLSGKLGFEQWESKDGQKRSKHALIALGFTFFSKPQQAAAQEQTGENSNNAMGPGDDSEIPF